jgi:hypothetical protein
VPFPYDCDKRKPFIENAAPLVWAPLPGGHSTRPSQGDYAVVRPDRHSLSSDLWNTERSQLLVFVADIVLSVEQPRDPTGQTLLRLLKNGRSRRSSDEGK